MDNTLLYEYDQAVRNEGYSFLCGVDEAGRGPLAGPVFTAAVIFPEGVQIEGINDSKKLSEKKRELLFSEIQKKAVSYCVACASEPEIEQINILEATFLAMNRAIQGLSVPPDFVIIDGDRMGGLELPHRCVVKGDAVSASIAAASILAKVSRDRYMVELAAKYPQYQFEKHKGYPTKLHFELLDQHGISPVHRRSFLRKYLQKKGTPL